MRCGGHQLVKLTKMHEETKLAFFNEQLQESNRNIERIY